MNGIGVRAGMKTDQPAVGTFDDLENFRGGEIEPVGGGEKKTRLRGSAAWAGVFYDFNFAHTACSDSSLREMR